MQIRIPNKLHTIALACETLGVGRTNYYFLRRQEDFPKGVRRKPGNKIWVYSPDIIAAQARYLYGDSLEIFFVEQQEGVAA
ncbi:MAG: hypothetical protein V7700_16390 [Halioglobus sp.]